MDFSVIVPVHNGGDDFRLCLEALSASMQAADELIVVDDGSTDSSALLANRLGVSVIVLEGRPHGPAVARNRGAALAQGDTLVFIDADVAVHPDTLGKMKDIFQKNPEVSALFGSYDDAPPKPGLVSRYKNLQHHFVHQNAQREASTFWAGCGGVRRNVFLKMGGFSESFPRPSIEDIELGLRLKGAGYRIWLCPEIQVTHLKHWTFSSLLRSDILDRAVPWTKLILSTSQLPADLNLNRSSRLSSVAVWAALAFLAIGFKYPPAWIGTLVSAAILVYLNFNFYRFITRREGLTFSIGAVILHSFYYLYSSFTFGVLFLWRLICRSGEKLAGFFQTKKSHKGAAV